MKIQSFLDAPTGRCQRISLKGFTIVELTLVIALMLSLIAVLFLGFDAYKRKSDEARCLLIQSTCQKALRAYQNLGSHDVGDPATRTTILGTGEYASDPGLVCPGGGMLSYGLSIPPDGTPWVTCSIPTHVLPLSPP